jgi:polyhydroxybutyrate depolymerase
MTELCEAVGAVVAFPQAAGRIGSGYAWDDAVDMPYLTKLVDELRRRYPTPEDRVCMAGMSGGARIASRFAALRADAVGVVGAVAGLRGPGAVRPSRPVAIVAFHGTADRINPYEGSGTARWDESVTDAALAWALANGVDRRPVEVAVSPNLRRATYGSAAGEVVLWTALGAGHTWPGSRLGLGLRLLLGRTTTEIDATAEIGRFWERHAGDGGSFC